MNTTILIDQIKNSTILKDIGKNRTLIKTQSAKEAFMYHIENSNVDSYVINTEGIIGSDLKTMVEHIHYLNAIISIFIFKPNNTIREKFLNKKNIHVADNEQEIYDILKNLPRIHRETNRVQWPLQVEYWLSDKPGIIKHWGIVLSLSSSGCFIRTDRKQGFELDDPVAMTFHFKDFDFFTEGKIVRLKIRNKETIEGIAIGFHEVSPQTKNCIQVIINEKILGELMETLKPEHDKL